MTIATLLSSQSAPEEARDRSNTVKLATWILLGVTMIVVIVRQIIKAIVFRKAAFDDLFILLATISAIGLAIIVIIIASEGLGLAGHHSTDQTNYIMKGFYATEMLYIVAIYCSKLPLLVLVYTIVAAKLTQRRAVLGLCTLISAWSLISLIAVAFQCELPNPWAILMPKCFNRQAFWIIYCIIDMSTEVGIIALSISLVAYSRIRLSRKIAVVACFAPRIFVMAASLARLVWLYPMTTRSDPEYYLWIPTIITEIHVCVAICTSCIPYMAPFFKSLESSLRRAYLSKSHEFRMKERPGSTLWSRRHQKQDVSNSKESSTARSLTYDRIPQASPHIPTPRPLSPMTPPQCHSPPSAPGRRNSSSSAQRGLCISIPGHKSLTPQIEIGSPRTASSFALSPSCASPMPLLPTRSYRTNQNASTPPSKARSSYTPSTDAYYASRPPSPPSPVHPRFSLFPQQSPQRHASPTQRAGGSPSVSIPPIRSLRSQNANSAARSSRMMSPHERSEELLLRVKGGIPLQPLKFSTAPRPASPPPTTTSPTFRQKHISTQELTSPMGTAINNYFKGDTPELPSQYLAPPSAKRRRNERVLSPANTSRSSPVLNNPYRNKPIYDPFEDDSDFPRDSIIVTRSSRANGMPRMKDARNNPRFVLG